MHYGFCTYALLADLPWFIVEKALTKNSRKATVWSIIGLCSNKGVLYLRNFMSSKISLLISIPENSSPWPTKYTAEHVTFEGQN